MADNNEQEYEIPITWQSFKRYKVTAKTLEEAVTKSLKQFFSEPDDHYIEDSFDIDPIIEEETGETFNMVSIINQL